MIRVLLDTTYARRAPRSGTAVYLAELQRALLAEGVEVVAVANPRRGRPAGGGLGSMANLLADARWTELELPRHARRTGAQIIHHPLPALAMWAPVPQVVTVADLAFERLPECFDARFRRFAHHAHRRAARRAAAVIAVSETTALDARELWAVPAERIVVARHGPGQPLPVPSAGERPEHFLYVGDGEPRKNLPRLLAAYAQYRAGAPEPLDLVFAGSASAAGPGIRVVSDPEPETIAELLAGAAALVQPSLYEGFGLTALEAMAAGTPVIAARSPGLIEVCGDAARYADGRSVADLAAALQALGGDATLRGELVRRGRQRAAAFSWAQSARQHIEAYSLALAR